MNREKHFHPLAALHLLRKTLLVYLLPLVQVLFDRNWDALRAALRQDLVLLVFISAVCWAVYYGSRWQVDAEGTVHVSWRLGVRLDRALRTEGLAALVLEQPLVYRLTGACRVVLYPVGQTQTITLYLTRQQAEKLADVLLPVTDPLWHAPKGGEKLAFTVLGANGLSTLFLWWLAIHQTQSYAPDAQTAALAQLGQLAALAARWLPLGAAWLLVLAGTLFCISLVRSALQAVHYTVWRTDTQLGGRGGLVRRYEMRLRLSQLNYADLRRSPATWALHYCPVFVSAGACRPELPLFVWREGTPLLRELLPEMAQLSPDTCADTTDRSMVFFFAGGHPAGALPAADGGLPHHPACPYPAAAHPHRGVRRPAGRCRRGLAPGGRMATAGTAAALSAAPVPSAPAVRVPPGHRLYRVAIPLGGDGAACQPDPCISRQRKGHGARVPLAALDFLEI